MAKSNLTRPSAASLACTERMTGGFRDCDTGAPIEGLPKARPCPFCGDADPGDIVQVEANDPNPEGPKFFCHVQCSGCLADGPGAFSQLEAAEAWNGTMPWRARSLSDQIADLPPLSDEDREAAESDYVAVAGALSLEPRINKAMLNLLQTLRMEVEQARCVA